MISSVFVTGRVGQSIDSNYRYVEVERPLVDQNGAFVIDRIPTRMPYFASSSWSKEKEGSYIAFKGRIEMDERLGLVLVIEHKEIYSPRMENITKQA